jgi:hypothetical protein
MTYDLARVLRRLRLRRRTRFFLLGHQRVSIFLFQRLLGRSIGKEALRGPLAYHLALILDNLVLLMKRTGQLSARDNREVNVPDGLKNCQAKDWNKFHGVFDTSTV